MKTLEEVLAYAKLPFELAPLQAADIRELAPFERVGLFWDVGGGKTVAATLICEMQEKDVNVVITWPILIDQWVEWLTATFPDQKVSKYYGPKRKSSMLSADWVVMSHHGFRDDFKKIVEVLGTKTHTLTVDEAQGLKNTGSKLYKYVKGFSAGMPLVMATGTTTTKPDDAYSYISLKTPQLYRSLGHFHNLHVEERDFFNNPVKWRDLDKISEALHLQASKRTKEEMFAGVLNPPEFSTVPYDLDPQHKKLYEQLVDECMLEFDNGTMIDGTTPQRLYHLTQQMILNWAHFAQDPTLKPAGLHLFDATVEQSQCLREGSSKLIVWTYHQLSSSRMLEYARKFDPHAVAAYGGSNSVKAVDTFMNDPRNRIMIANPLSVGAGLNAMKVCWEMLFLEFSTVPMHIRQSIGRVDRVGQQHIPNIRFGVARGTVQESLLKRLLSNDDNVTAIERNPQSLRRSLLGG